VTYDGSYALRVQGASEERALVQRLARQVTLDLRGGRVTLTAQVWAAAEGQRGWLRVTDPDHDSEFETSFVAGPEWRTVTLEFEVPQDAWQLDVALVASPSSELLFDQVSIVGGTAADQGASWLRDGSGEQVPTAGEALAVWIGGRLGRSGLVQRLLTWGPSNVRLLLDNREPLRLAFQSFWGNFGAALVVPLAPLVYRVLTWACVASLVGLGVYACRVWSGKSDRLAAWQRSSLLVFGGAVCLMLVQMLANLVAVFGRWGPQGRYLFPVLVPVAVLLTVGWLLPVGPVRLRWLAVIPGSLGLLVLDCVALRRILAYFCGI
jgi:hypothetical protein